MRIGIMGGTFDPIHCGHVHVAHSVSRAYGLDAVWFMLAHTAPQKERPPVASVAHRLEMVKRAVAHVPSWHVSEIELHRGGVSYTYDTVMHLCGHFPAYTWYWIVGADRLQGVSQWHRIAQCVQHCRIIGVNRDGVDPFDVILPDTLHVAVHRLRIVDMLVSSTDIRQRCQKKLPFHHLVHDDVSAYIEHHRLYEEE